MPQVSISFTKGETSGWVSPPDVTSVLVECWGGGGAGASMSNQGGGGSGGGGAYASSLVTVTANTLYAITVGGGGAASTTQGVTNGGTTTFGASTVVAVGGTGVVQDSITGGNGGLTGSCTGTTLHAGGAGGGGSSAGRGAGSGGSGGSGGNTGDAGSGSAGSASAAGSAGSAGSGGGATGVDGVFHGTGGGVTVGNPGIAPGGGGSGASRSSGAGATGGSGAAGRVTLTYTTGVQTTPSTSTPFASPSNWNRGNPHAGRPFFAANSGLWWNFLPDATTNTQLNAFYSSDFLTWTQAGNVFTSAQTLRTFGSKFASVSASYANIASTDVVHIGWVGTDGFNTVYNMHVRATLTGGGTPNVTFGSEIQISSFTTGAPRVHAGVKIDGAGNIWHTTGGASDGSGGTQNPGAYLSSHADLGSSWTSGFGAVHVYETLSSPTAAGSGNEISTFAFDLGSGNALHLWVELYTADVNTSGAPNVRNIRYVVYSSSSWGTPGNVLASDVTDLTNVFEDGWAVVARSTSDIHVVVFDGSTGNTHRRFNGSSWANGDSVPTLGSIAQNTRLLVTDGTSVWMLAIITDNHVNSTIAPVVWMASWASGSGWTWSQVYTASTAEHQLGFIQGGPSVSGSLMPVIVGDLTASAWLSLPVAATPPPVALSGSVQGSLSATGGPTVRLSGAATAGGQVSGQTSSALNVNDKAVGSITAGLAVGLDGAITVHGTVSGQTNILTGQLSAKASLSASLSLALTGVVPTAGSTTASLTLAQTGSPVGAGSATDAPTILLRGAIIASGTGTGFPGGTIITNAPLKGTGSVAGLLNVGVNRSFVSSVAGSGSVTAVALGFVPYAYPSVPHYQILIDGVDYATFATATGMQITQNFGKQGDQMTVSLVDEHATPQPTFVIKPLSQISVVDTRLKRVLFGGIVSMPEFQWLTPNLTMWSLTCRDYTYFADNAVVTGDYVGLTADAIVQLLLTQANCGITGHHVLPGPRIDHVRINYLQLSAAWTKVAKYASLANEWDWFVDENKDLHFFSWTSIGATPYYFTDDSHDRTSFAGHYDAGNLKYDWDGQTLRNRVTVRGANYTNATTDFFTGNRFTNAWTMTYPLDTTTPKMTLLVNGISKTVSIYTGGLDPNQANTDTDYITYQDPSGNWILHLGSDIFPGSDVGHDVPILFTYNYTAPIITRLTSTTSVNKYAYLGNNGVFEMYVADQGLTTLAAAQQLGMRELTQYANVQERVSFRTTEDFIGHIRTGETFRFVSQTIPDSLNNWVAGLNATFLCVSNRISSVQIGQRTYDIQAVRTDIPPGGIC